MSNYKYDSFLDVVTGFANGELDGYVLDVGFEWVSLLKKTEADLTEGHKLWVGSQPNTILEELLKNVGVPINE